MGGGAFFGGWGGGTFAPKQHETCEIWFFSGGRSMQKTQAESDLTENPGLELVNGVSVALSTRTVTFFPSVNYVSKRSTMSYAYFEPVQLFVGCASVSSLKVTNRECDGKCVYY